MSAGRMPQRYHARQIELVGGRKVLEMIDGLGDIVEDYRKVAAIADPPKLDVPRCETRLGKRRTDRLDVLQVVECAPKAAVNDDDYRVRTRCARDAQDAIILRV